MSVPSGWVGDPDDTVFLDSFALDASPNTDVRMRDAT
jgi:hypothetical protein